ncbi:MAG: modification methylase, partial [Microvirga sp.]
RVPFLSLLEAGLISAGVTLTDERRRHKALVRPDGTLALGPATGSIHKIGALAQGLPACNGWTFWHAERSGALVAIDAFRATVRAAMATT